MRTLLPSVLVFLLALSCAAPIDVGAPSPPRVRSSEILAEPGARDLDVADADGDGLPDLLVTFGDPASPTEDHGLALSRSGVGFERRRILVGAATARLGDVDGDGLADVVVADGQGLGVLRGSAEGPRPMDLRRSGRETELLALRTRDGVAEALATDARGRLAVAPLAQPEIPAAEIDLAPARPLLVADADGDGQDDLLLDLPSGELGVRRGRGASFEPAAYLLGARHATAVAVGGAPRIVAASSGARLFVLGPDGRGFRLHASVALPRAPAALVVGDVDADGRADLVAVSSGAVDVLCDVSVAARLCLSESAAWERPRSGRMADLDGDGAAELLVTEPGTGVHVLRFAR
jgi:hypothetical protein